MQQAGTPRGTVAAAPIRVTRVSGSKDSPALSSQLYARARESTVRVSLHIVNTGTKRVELTFPSGKTYDFVILDSLGRELWHWSDGRMFTQALRNRLLGGGETLDFEETWDAPLLPPGRYTARGVLASENYPIVQQVSFVVTRTTVASR